MKSACDIRVRGVVQGVGFRPFVFRLAQANTLAGWVLNDEEGVEIHLEGTEASLRKFVSSLRSDAPPAAEITMIDVRTAQFVGFDTFTIRDSRSGGHPTVRISPDLPVCASCLAEMLDPANRRYRYPYINCTDCGPRYSVILSLPYDRPNTTMRAWELDGYYKNSTAIPCRRFHAQPVACPACGPHYRLVQGDATVNGDERAIARAVKLLNEGAILAVKGLGGFHLACDARNQIAVEALRLRKFRKEKPFAVMAANAGVARTLLELSPESQALLTSAARPIVLARARADFPGLSPDNDDLGVMLPYAPLHHLPFDAGAPEVLVMTSANRSNEPIAYRDEEALDQLAGIADAFPIGERPIARRVEDSIARAGTFGPVILRVREAMLPRP